MLVRPADRSDAEALAAVHLATVVVAYAGLFPPDAPSLSFEVLVDEWTGAFDDPSFRAFLAVEGEEAVGTVGLRADPDFRGCGQLRRLHVLPDRWGSGIGTALYDAAVEVFTKDGFGEAGLWVLEANTRARRFYERQGWTLVPGAKLEWRRLGVIEIRYRLVLPSPPTRASSGKPAVR